MEHQFKFGDKVQHEKYGLGVVIGTDKLVRVFFEDGTVVGFYTARVANEDRLVSELSPASDWIKIDWDDKSTLPPYDGFDVLITGEYYSMEFSTFYHDTYSFTDFDIDATHWMPAPNLPND